MYFTRRSLAQLSYLVNAFERLLNESNLKGLQKGNGTAGKRKTFRSRCSPRSRLGPPRSRPGPPLRPDRRPPQAEVRDPGPRLPGTSAPTRPPRPCPTRWVAGLQGPPDSVSEVIEGGWGTRSGRVLAGGGPTPEPPEPHLSCRTPGASASGLPGAGLPAPA